MLRSLYAGVAGLRVHQTKMDVIGNNIANVNTTGFKGQRVTFKEMLSQTIRSASSPNAIRGGLNPMQIGLGVSMGSIDADFSQGNLQATGKMTDIAIQGNGFFVVNDGSRNLFTRAGVFTFDQTGSLIHSTTGFRVQGWMANENGELPNMNPSTMGTLSLGELNMNPMATTEILYKGNLNTKKEVGDLSYGPERITVSDENGRSGQLYIKLTKIAGGNTPDRIDDRWTWQAASDVKIRNQALAAPPVAGAAPSPLPAIPGNFLKVNDGTVVLRDTATGTTYTEGQDYIIHYATGQIEFPVGSVCNGIATIVVDYDAQIEAATGEVTLDRTGAIASNTVQNFTIDITDSIGGSLRTVNITAPLVGQTGGGFFEVPTTGANAGVNASTVNGDFGPVKVTSQTVYDSKGTAYTLNVSFVKTGENRWDWWASGPLADDGTPLPLTANYGTIFFDAQGKVLGTPTGGPVSFQPAGSERLFISPKFAQITQFDDNDSVNATDADGYEAGTLEAFAIDEGGIITGAYTNGLTKTIGCIGVATFSNAAGLIRDGETIFSESNNSGIAEYGVPGEGGKGVLSAGTLEMSNVDLADQFTEMITTQRGFQASSKIIQTADQILQDLVGLKR